MDKDPRPSWDEYFLEITKVISTRADCSRRQVGAVLVDDNHRIISTGYNGAPMGAPGCLTKQACPRGLLTPEECPPFSPYGNCIAIHAERNAILYANTEEIKGTTLYISCAPCTDCHQLILAVGIKEIVWKTPDGSIARERQFH